MRKPLITIVFISALITAASPGFTMDVMLKIRDYIKTNFTQMPNLNDLPYHDSYATLIPDYPRHPEIAEYAIKVIESPANPLGYSGILLYGEIGDDHRNILKFDDGTQRFAVGTPAEYYFTDMVFIQEKYEEAIFDLYLYRADFVFNPWQKYEFFGAEQRIENAINNSFVIFNANGFDLDRETFESRLDSLLDERFAEKVDRFNDKYRARVPNIETYSEIFMEALKTYYKDPTISNLEGIMQTAIEIGDRVEKDGIDFPTLDVLMTIDLFYLGGFLTHYYNRDTKKIELSSINSKPIENSKYHLCDISGNEKDLVFSKG